MRKPVQLNFNTPPYQNTETIFLNESSEFLYDGFIDDSKASVKRPGLATEVNLGTNTQVYGSYWWEVKNKSVHVSDGQMYTLDYINTKVKLTNTDLLQVGVRPTFADNGDYIISANGGRILYSDGTAGSAAFIADSDAPTQVTHVAFLDQYAICNEVGTGRFHYCDFIGAPTAWFAIDVYSAESDPDAIIGLYVCQRVIIIIGTRSIEFWYNSGGANAPFSRMEGTVIGRGGMSGYSQCQVNENFYMFDDKRRFIGLSGTAPTLINSSFDKVFQGLSTISDCTMDYCTVLGREFIIVNFPTEDRTFIYDIKGSYFCEWSYWDAANNIRKRFLGNSYTYDKVTNRHLFGSVATDKIYSMDLNNYADDGIDIHFSKKTGFFDQGFPTRRKRSSSLTFKLKTGTGLEDGNTNPFARIRFIDINKNGDIVSNSNWMTIDLLKQGERGFLRTLFNMGSYYARQYELECTEQIPFAIGEVVEEVDALEF